MHKQLPLIIAMLLAQGEAHAAEAHRLAHSSKMGVEVFAQPQADGAWCKERLELEVRLQPDSSLLPDGAGGLMPKLASVFAAECPSATTARVTPLIVQASGNKAAGEPFIIDAAKGWQKVAPETTKAPLTPVGGSVAPTAATPAVTEVSGPASLAEAHIAAANKQPLPQAAPSPVPSVEPMPVEVSASAKADIPEPVTKANEPQRPDMAQYPMLDWYHLAHALAYYRPELRGTVDLNRAFAYTQDCVGYNKVSRNELDLQDFVAKYKAESDRLASQLPQRALLTYEVRLAEYDQMRQGFPLEEGAAASIVIGLRNKQTSQCAYYGSMPLPDRSSWPYQFKVEFSQDAAPSFLPMSMEDARAFLKKSNGYRTVEVRALVDIVKFEQRDGGWQKEEVFTLRPAWVDFHESSRAGVLLGSVSGRELEAIRTANEAARKVREAKQQEEERVKMAKRMEEMRQARMEQRQRELEILVRSATPAQRAGYLNMAGFHGFSTAAAATLASIQTGLPHKATLLVRVEKSGEKDIPAAWPGRLVLDAEGGEVEGFKAGRWYVIHGLVRAESPKPNQIIGRMNVTEAVACEKEACAEYADEERITKQIAEMARQYALQSYPETQ
ncbi:DUF4852 domain-containing protein [Thiofaba sp. EF100]|uniref:DUF4852 domain-containing protein n=1 Tax=Thiofaba sp. EF100 TaxID=3121274 RepID=UPI0032218488